ncbi:cytosine permease [Phormidesmis sp. 146-12]
MSSSIKSQTAAKSLVEEDYPLSPVPWSERRSIWSLAPLLMGFALTSTTLFAGGKVGPAFRFAPDLISIILIGNLILGLYCSALGYIAYKSGLSTVLMARFSFGNIGSRWVDFILGFTQIGWYAYTSALVGDVVNKLLGIPPSWNWLSILFFTYAFCSTAYIGYRAMDWLSRLAVPLMVILILWSLVIATHQVGGFAGIQAIAPTAQLSVGQALTVIVATFISGGTQSTNWSRFANSGGTAIGGTLAAFLGVNGLMVFAGAYCALVYGNQDIVQVMAQQGILLGGIVLLLLNIWTTQDNTIYAFAVASANMFRINKRTVFVLGGATIALVLAWAGIYEMLVPYLIFLGTVIPPVGGIIMADFWFYRQGQFPSLDETQPAFNWAGIISYVVASVVAYISSNNQTGIVFFDIAPVNGVIVAAVLYVILSKVLLKPLSLV